MTNRELNQRRIVWATRGLTGAAILATGIFAGAAAHHTNQARGQGVTPVTAAEDEGDDDGFLTLTPSTSAPSQTFQAPVATSAGS
jgi:hypothetical protein